MKCSRCPGEFGFLDGFLTPGGMICPRCKEVGGLEKILNSLLQAGAAGELFDALGENPRSLKDATRLAELAPERQSLRVALLARGRLDGKESDLSFHSDPDLAAEASALLFARFGKPAEILRLLELNRLEKVRELLASIEIEISEEWLAVMDSIAGRGDRQAAVGLSLRMKGVPSRAYYALVAKLLAEEDLPAAEKWAGRTRFVSLEDRVGFLEAIKTRARAGSLSENLFSAILAATLKPLAGTGDELRLLLSLGEREAAFAALRRRKRLASDELSFLEELAGQGETTIVWEILESLAAPGPESARLTELVARLGDPARAVEIMVKCGRWRDAAVRLAADPAALELMRARCAEAEVREEALARGEIAEGMTRALAGAFREARALFARIAASETAPVAALTARSLELLLLGSEMEASALMASRFETLEKRRSVGLKPLKDAGSVVKNRRRLEVEFIEKVGLFLKADTLPHLALLLPAEAMKPAAANREPAGDDPEKRFEEAARARDVSFLTEAIIIRPTILRLFEENLRVCATPELGPARIERAPFHGVLARRLHDPLNPRSEEKQAIGSRELILECAGRALAFLPEVSVTSESRWGEFVFKFRGMMTHLGENANLIRKVLEFRAGWESAGGADLPESPFLPLLDEPRPFTKADYMGEAPPDPTESRVKATW